jgi:hypothetical protein
MEYHDYLKVATAGVLKYTKIDLHDTLRLIVEGIQNKDMELSITQKTVVNIVTKEGEDYHEGNYAEKGRL